MDENEKMLNKFESDFNINPQKIPTDYDNDNNQGLGLPIQHKKKSNVINENLQSQEPLLAPDEDRNSGKFRVSEVYLRFGVRLEAKTTLANERTFLKWMNVAFTILTLGLLC